MQDDPFARRYGKKPQETDDDPFKRRYGRPSASTERPDAFSERYGTAAVEASTPETPAGPGRFGSFLRRMLPSVPYDVPLPDISPVTDELGRAASSAPYDVPLPDMSILTDEAKQLAAQRFPTDERGIPQMDAAHSPIGVGVREAGSIVLPKMAGGALSATGELLRTEGTRGQQFRRFGEALTAYSDRSSEELRPEIAQLQERGGVPQALKTVASGVTTSAPALAGGVAAAAVGAPAIAGAAIGTLPMAVGDTYTEQLERGMDPKRAALRAYAAAPLYAGLEAIGPGRVVRRGLGRMPWDVGNIAIQGGIEAVTEGSQSVLSQGVSDDWLEGIDWSRAFSEAGAGGMTGLAFGVAGKAAQDISQRDIAPPEEQAAVTDLLRSERTGDAESAAGAEEQLRGMDRLQGPQAATEPQPQPESEQTEPVNLTLEYDPVGAAPEPELEGPAEPEAELAGEQRDPLADDVAIGGLEPEPEVAPEPVELESAGEAYNVNPTTELDVEPERFQYKELVSSKTGASAELKDIEVYNPDLGGVVAVWRDPADGRLKVVNGHHRIELARRADYPRVLVREIPVSTASEARRTGALVNIAEGRGTPIDAAKVFREGSMSESDLAAIGVSIRGQMAADGMALSRLPDALFQQAATHKVAWRRLAVIGRAGLTEDQQLALWQMVKDEERSGKRLTNEEIAELARFVSGAGEASVNQETLFGTETVDESLALDKARMSSWLKSELRKESSLFKYVSRGDRAERLEAGDVGQIDKAKAGELGGESATVLEVYDRLSAYTGPISDALNDAVRTIRAGGKESDVRQGLVEQVRAAVAEELGGGSELAAGLRGGETPAIEDDPTQGSLLGESRPAYGPEGELEGPTRNAFPESGGFFYSRLERAIEQAPQDQMSAAQWRGYLKPGKRGFGASELEWTGLVSVLDDLEAVSETIPTVEKDYLVERVRSTNAELGEVRLPASTAVETEMRLADVKELYSASQAASFDARARAEVAIEEAIMDAVPEDSRARAAVDRTIDDALNEPKATIQDITDYARGWLLDSEGQQPLLDLSAAEQPLKDYWAARAESLELATEMERLQARPAESKYEKYTEPGGENYREVLVQLNNAIGNRYTSGHWETDNVAVHLRLKDRELAGGKALFIEEIQSDWAQAGRKGGYVEPMEDQEAAFAALEDSYAPLMALGYQADNAGTLYFPGVPAAPATSYNREFEQATGPISGLRDGSFVPMPKGHAPLARAYWAALDEVERIGRGVPDTPYKSTDAWVGLALRRALLEAVDGGYDRVAWTSGDQQAARYDLSKQIYALYYRKNEDGSYDLLAKEQEYSVLREAVASIKPSALPDYVGKEVADRIVAGEGTLVTDEAAVGEAEAGLHVMTGPDLKIGGEGMRTFYDRVIPKVLAKEAKRLGVTVQLERVDMEGREQAGDPSEWYLPEGFRVEAAPDPEIGPAWIVWDDDAGEVVAGAETAEEAYTEALEASDYLENRVREEQELRGAPGPIVPPALPPHYSLGRDGDRWVVRTIVPGRADHPVFGETARGAYEATRLADQHFARNTEPWPSPTATLVPSIVVTPELVRAVRANGFMLMESQPDYDLFGNPLVPAETQGDLLDDAGPQGMTDALNDAQATVSALEGRVERGDLTEAEQARYDEARSLIRSSEGAGLDQDELLARREGEDVRDERVIDLFEAGEFRKPKYTKVEPDGRDRDELVFGSEEDANLVRENADQTNSVLYPDEGPDLSPEGRLERVRRPQAGRVDVRGVQLSSDEATRGGQLRALFQSFRDPKNEILHVVYTDDAGTILGHTYESSGDVSGGVLLRTTSEQEARFRAEEHTTEDVYRATIRFHKELDERAKRLGATQVVFAHNHPSGEVKTSKEDRDFTKFTSAALDVRVAGQYVLDHEEAAFIRPDGEVYAFKVPPSGASPWLERRGDKIKGPPTGARLVREHGHLADDGGAVLYLDAQLNALALEPLTLPKTRTMRRWLSQRMRAYGSDFIIVVVGPDADHITEAARTAFRLGVRQPHSFSPGEMLDVIQITGPETSRSLAAEGQIFQRPAVGIRTSSILGEDRGTYSADETGVQTGLTGPDADLDLAFGAREEALEEFRGAPTRKIRERVAGALDRIRKDFQTSFQYIDPKKGPIFSELQDVLRRHRQVRAYAQAVAAHDLYEVTRDLSKEHVRTFERALILPDLIKDVEAQLYDGKELPFGYLSESELRAHEAATQEEAAANPLIEAALEKRRQLNKDLTRELVEAELLPATVLEDDRYWHRQVTKYMEASGFNALDAQGVDARIRQKGFQRSRVGGTEFNTAYHEAEFEWVSQARALLQTKEHLDEIQRIADVLLPLKRKAKEQNLRLLGEKLGVEPAEVLKPFSQKIAIAQLAIAKRAIEFDGVLLPAGTGWADDVAYSLTTEYSDWLDLTSDLDAREKKGVPFRFDHPDWFRFLKLLAELDVPGSGPARGIFKAIVEREQFIKEELGEDYVEWKTNSRAGLESLLSLAPEGYTLWQPQHGNHFFLASTIEERALDDILAGNKALEDDDVRRQMMMGGPRETWIVPEDLAKQLDNWAGRDVSDVERAAQLAQTYWKQWILLNPGRALKYNLNNMSGDADVAFAAAPGVLRHVRGDLRDLRAWNNGEAGTDLREELERGVLLGVLDSGFSGYEVPDINEHKLFQDLVSNDRGVVSRAMRGYWRTARDFTTTRENLLRLSAWRYYRRMLAENPGRRIYSASKKDEIDALWGKGEDWQDKVAAKLSRELIGDYGNISVAGGWIRRTAIPFWSWLEINAPRYYRLFKNMKHDELLADQGGRIAGAVGKSVAGKAALLALRVNAYYALAAIAGSVLWPDDDDLPEDLQKAEKRAFQRGRRDMHLPLYRDDNGRVVSVRIEGAFSDALEWVGLDDLPEDISDVVAGRSQIVDKVAEMPKSVIDRIVQGFRPDVTTGFELATGKQLYPSIFTNRGADFTLGSTRPIRDKGLHAIGPLDPINKMAGRLKGKPAPPGSGIGRGLRGLVLYESDPKESAYWEARTLVREWKRDQGEESGGVTPTKRANALYYYRRSLAMGDTEAADRYKAEYEEHGGSASGMATSVARAAVLAGMDPKEKRVFRATLSPEDLQILELGEAWYQKTYKGRGKLSGPGR